MIKNRVYILIATFFVVILVILALNDLQTHDLVYKDLARPSDSKNYDVIVFGSEPEGISAAVSAARSDLEVVLITEDEEVGGLMTLGGLNFIDMNYDHDGTLLTRGIFKEFHDKVGGNAFEIDKAIKIFRKMLYEEKVPLKTNTNLKAAITDEDKITGLELTTAENQAKSYTGKRVIDASADADLAAKAGVPYIIAGEDINHDDRPMGVTLVFEVTDINWPKMFMYLNLNRVLGEINNDYRKDWGARLDAAWGYTKKGHAYEPSHDDIIVRGLNVARQEDNRSLINALLVLDVDPLCEDSKEKAREKAIEEIEDLIPYLRDKLPGFERVELHDVAKRLYVRESRYIRGEYVLDINDVLGNNDHFDRVAIGGYPVDIQPTARRPTGVVVGHPDRYSIPFRSLVPLKVENLLVVGRSASFCSLAGGSTRVIPVGMTTAEAAGVAAKHSINNSLTFRELAENRNIIQKIQEELISRGAYLEAFEREDPLEGKRAYESIKTLRELGVLYGGYDNNYRLDEPISRGRFQSITNTIISLSGLDDDVGTISISEDEKLTSRVIFKKVLLILESELEADNEVSFEESKELLLKKEILPEDIKADFKQESTPDSEGALILLANLYDFLQKQ